MLYLVIRTRVKNKTNVTGKITGWKTALNAPSLYYSDPYHPQLAITAPYATFRTHPIEANIPPTAEICGWPFTPTLGRDPRGAGEGVANGSRDGRAWCGALVKVGADSAVALEGERQHRHTPRSPGGVTGHQWRDVT